ncbi:VC0807 family protein [Lysinibacillus xylanilyticus]|uniref:VC0807 family protein n=1 Tax=Lysinibacillus xylanilyticus TaxID=582475 RepID=UPI003D005A08
MVKKQRSNKILILFELIFYAALPYVIWNLGREPLGDYTAMLISTIPGIVYTIYRFILDKQFNITGLLILSSLALGTTVDLLSGSAEQMIWNGVYLSLFYTFLYIVTLMIKRPVESSICNKILMSKFYKHTKNHLLSNVRLDKKWLLIC